MSTIKQKTAFVEVEGMDRITIRRMKNKATREFVKQLGALLLKLHREGFFGRKPAAEGETPASFFDTLLPQLPALIADAEELVSHVITSSTDLSLAQYDDLDALVASEVLRVALDTTYDDELKNSWAGIVGSVLAGPAKTQMS
jgi:hypothetical protein